MYTDQTNMSEGFDVTQQQEMDFVTGGSVIMERRQFKVKTP